MFMALSKHIPEIERQSYTLYREKSVHTLARKHANLNLSAWSLLFLTPNARVPMQIKMKNNANPYRSLQVMHFRHLLNKSVKKEQLHRVLHSDNLNQRYTFYRPSGLRSTLPEFYSPQQINVHRKQAKSSAQVGAENTRVSTTR